MFKITEHVDFDQKGRALCPACTLAKGTGYRNKNLSLVGDQGAYKCHRLCTTEEIREALGQAPDRQVPTAIAKPPAKAIHLTPDQVTRAADLLANSSHALPWLTAKGIPPAAVLHYNLGVTRTKVGSKHLPAIAIPIPTGGGDSYYQKKRVAPWLPPEERGDAPPWSQYGIPAMVYLTHSPDGAEQTYLCEGEWDAIRLGWDLRHQTAIAVACFTCGAGNVPAAAELDRLPGKITIFYDIDEPGQKGATKLSERLKDRSAIATVPHPENPPKGWDISDALNSGVSIEAIHAAAAAATAWGPPQKENPLRLRLQTNDEMIAGAQDYVEWLVPDLLTSNELFILGMPPRGGKSLFGLTLAKAVATGGAFLDRPVTQGSVIYINLEDAPTKIKQRQIAQGWGEGLPVHWMDKFKLSELAALQELAAEIPDLRLVVLDTFSRVRDDGQKESSAELGKILEPLQEWAKDSGICILITHHTGKTNSEHASSDPFDALRGSTSIRATCRGAIVIVPGESSYRLLAENGYADRLDVNVRINPETLEWKLVGNWTPRIDGDMKTQILDHLNLIGAATVTEIATALNFNASSVSTVMGRLHRDNLVSKRAGAGRSPGVYTRSSNLLKQFELQIEHPNAIPVRPVDVAQTNNLSKRSPSKVINGGKSDQSIDHPPQGGDQWPKEVPSIASGHFVSPMYQNGETQSVQALETIDHFSVDHPTQYSCLSKPSSPDGESDSSSNSGLSSLSKFNQTEEWAHWPHVGTLVKIVSRRGGFATVRVPGTRATVKVPLSELGQPVKE